MTLAERPPRAARMTGLEFRRNAVNVCGGTKLLRSLERFSARVVVLDPQYRAVLDEQQYGNEGVNRGKARSALPQMTDDMIATFVELSCRALEPSGYLLLWIDKFSLGTGRHLQHLRHAPLLGVVDIIAWNKDRMGMGRRARCVTEYVVVCQKHPREVLSWKDHGIPDSWTEKPARYRHPHEKPMLLLQALLGAVARPGALVVDPCAGSYAVLGACRAIELQFLGCDLVKPKEKP